MDKQEVINYLMYTPYNTNLAVLKSMLGDGDWSELLDYVRRTSYKMNRHVLDGILGAAESDIVLVDGTYEFNQDGLNYYFVKGIVDLPISDTITVIFDGQTYELPKATLSGSIAYGEVDGEGMPIFDNYPVAIMFNDGGAEIATESAGSHSVKVVVSNDGVVKYKTVLDGTFVFTSQGGVGGQYVGEYNKFCTSQYIKVTFDGYPNILSGKDNLYRSFYVVITFKKSGIQIDSLSTGEHIVKVEIPVGSEADFDDDSSSAIVGEAIVGEAVVGEITIDNGGRR